MDKSSLKSGYIRGRALHRISGKSHFSNRIHSFMDRPALPVPILVGLHFIQAVIDADGLVHASFVAFGRPICNGHSNIQAADFIVSVLFQKLLLPKHLRSLKPTCFDTSQVVVARLIASGFHRQRLL